MLENSIAKDFVETKFQFQVALQDVELSIGGTLLCHQANRDGIEIDGRNILEFAHYLAIENWLMQYTPLLNATKLEKVRGYLEAFHHFCEISQWETASKLLLMEPDVPAAKALHEQLGLWGYYQEQIDLCQRLLGKLNPSFDCLCLNGLGSAYRQRGQVKQALLYYQQELEVARTLKAPVLSAQALLGIAEVAWLQCNVQAVLDSAQEALSLACSSDSLPIKAKTLILLGSAYSLNPDTVPSRKVVQCSIQSIQQALEIAQSLSDQALEVYALSALGGAYLTSGRTQAAISHITKQLGIAKETGNLHQQWVALSNLGIAYGFIGDSKNAISYTEQALLLIEQTGNPYYKATNVSNLSAFYTRAGDFSCALEILQTITQIHKETGQPYWSSTDCLSLSYCNSGLKQFKQAIWYARKALVLARRERSQEMYAFGIITLAHAYCQKGQKFYGMLVFMGQIPLLLQATLYSNLARFILRAAIITFSQPICNVIDRILNLLKLQPRHH